ncbi:hypothetical protein SAMN05660493_00640 [Epilithonimonas bovis DSM 19482]|uniref:Uncharacterized protein n=1 Tax=Epilithonimonas bovis DSM 19482 TaxID=1121284 RepID=A0A1U7PSR9_9FLAO|nr:hypothetical protein [Epilithonimonas bovis]QIY82860.1 hypothetical protein HER18_04570 [Chryseobacterium sp. NEB161]SIT95969.1 hypothetical protein SAMN05660493_00640 [Epilithonimonas bovis DSM 19482]HBR11055.1 hypothetical protein [Chryseobacterium sp.]
MRYKLLKRNRIFRSDSHSRFIKWMRETDLQQWNDNKDFMEGYAYRKSTFENMFIRYDNEDVFVEDLQKNNLLKIESSKGLFGLFQF